MSFPFSARVIASTALLLGACAPVSYSSVQELCELGPDAREGAVVQLTIEHADAAYEIYSMSLILCGEPDDLHGPCCNQGYWAPRYACGSGPDIVIFPPEAGEPLFDPLICAANTSNGNDLEECGPPSCHADRIRVVGQLRSWETRAGEQVLLLEASSTTALD